MSKQNHSLIEWNGVTLTVAPATIRSAMMKDRIMMVGEQLHADPIVRYQFARCAAQTVIDDGDLNWAPPTSYTPEDIQASFDAWMELPEKLYRQWIDAINAIDAPTAPDELQEDFDPDSASPEE